MSDRMQYFANQWNCTLVSWEYAGYGPRHAEYPSAESMRRDIIALYDYLQGENVYVFGHSIGTGPAAWLASQRADLAGCILQSPYTTIGDIVKEKWWLPCPAIFDNLTAIQNTRAPLLLIHGEDDTLIPVTHSVRLAEAAVLAKSRKLVRCTGSTHNDWDIEYDVIAPVHSFLQ
jgi:pimeloyl-ACP methyl ester carboxylesterase